MCRYMIDCTTINMTAVNTMLMIQTLLGRVEFLHAKLTLGKFTGGRIRSGHVKVTDSEAKEQVYNGFRSCKGHG